MKTSLKTSLSILLMSAICFSTLNLAASTPFSVAQPAVQLEADPPKKKCRKCHSRFRPNRMFKKNQVDINLGVGLVPTFVMDGAKTKMIPLSFGLEYRFSEMFSLGLMAGHSVSESKPRIIGDGFQATWTNSYTNIALRPAIHITTLEDWDFYGGFAIGMDKSKVTGETLASEADLRKYENHLGIEGSRTSASFSGFAGVRYVLAPRWTVGGELGFGVSILTVGVNYLLSGAACK